MYKWLKPLVITCILVAAIVELSLPSLKVAKAATGATPPPLIAKSAILIDMTTGQILYAKNPYERLYPASITKIMTALLALKDGHLSDSIRASAYAVNQEPDKVYLVPGEVHSLKQMLYGLLIDSANDAAVAIAQHYGGSVQGFAAMMNKEAKQLGAVNTHFVNPNGLQNKNHYTCAYDMALIARKAMTYPEFKKIVDTKYYLWKGYEWTSDLANLNEMLWTYPGANGIKTGWTDQAEQTMVVSATQNGHTLLAVLMKVPLLGEIQTDATNLLNYGFSDFANTALLPAGTKITTATIAGHQTEFSLYQPLVADLPLHTAKQVAKLEVPYNLQTLKVQPGLETIAGTSNVAPLDSATPILKSVTIAPLAPGIKKGAVVGNTTIEFAHMQVSLPIQIDEAIPLPKPQQQKSAMLPLLMLALISLGVSLLTRLQEKKRRRNRIRSGYPRAADNKLPLPAPRNR